MTDRRMHVMQTTSLTEAQRAEFRATWMLPSSSSDTTTQTSAQPRPGSDEPAAWHHIGQHMRADAGADHFRPSWLERTTHRRGRLIRIRIVIAVALVSAAVLVLNGAAKGMQP